jgi:hypothetical protein
VELETRLSRFPHALLHIHSGKTAQPQEEEGGHREDRDADTSTEIGQEPEKKGSQDGAKLYNDSIEPEEFRTLSAGTKRA